MKLDINKDLLQNEIPTNKWLVKDDNEKIIRSLSPNVADPEHLTNEEELCMKRLIDFTRYSQDDSLNKQENEDYLRPAVGLAAPQIGVNKNMFYIRIDWGTKDVEEYAMINPKIIAKSDQIVALEDGEGCLSVDVDRPGIVPRSYKIVAEGYDYLRKEYLQLTLRDYPAIVFQHEMEHNFGHLYYDLINTKDPNHAENDWILI